MDIARVVATTLGAVLGLAGVGLLLWAAQLVFGGGPKGCTLDCLAYPVVGLFVGTVGLGALSAAAVVVLRR